MLPGVYYYYPVTSIGKHTHYTVRDYDSRHTRASTALSAAVALVSRAVCISITQNLRRMDNHKTKKMKFETNKHETKLSMKLTAQAQARILSKTHRV